MAEQQGVVVGNLYELLGAMAGGERQPRIEEAGPPAFVIAVAAYEDGGVHFEVHGDRDTPTLAVAQALIRAAFELIDAARPELEEEKTPH